MKPIDTGVFLQQLARLDVYSPSISKHIRVLGETHEHPDTIGLQWAGVVVRGECFIEVTDRFIEAVDKTIKAAEAVR